MNESSLEAVCADRPLLTHEIYTQNDYYGHASNMKKHLGINDEYPLKFMIAHGVNMSTYVWDIKISSHLDFLVCANDYYAKIFNWRTDNKKTALPIGPQVQFSASFDNLTPQYILVFPPHSTHHVYQHYEIEKYLDKITRLTGGNKVRICLGWKDILFGTHRAYINLGYEVVSAGHMYDQNFLSRFKTILRQASHVISGGCGTELVYSSYSGILSSYVPPEHVSLSFDESRYKTMQDDIFRQKTLRNCLRKNFLGYNFSMTEKQKSISDYVSGKKYIRAKEFLLDLVLLAEFKFCKKMGLKFQGVPLSDGTVLK